MTTLQLETSGRDDDLDIDRVGARRVEDGSTDERGAGLVEYALLVALIAIVCVGGVTLLGSVTASQYSSVTVGLVD